MAYNGVGLLTPRGSGTSGYVQTNKFNLRGPPGQRPMGREALDAMAGPKQARADQSILVHKAKRELELKIAEEQAKLEDEGLPEEDIAEAIALYRSMLMETHASTAAEAEAKKPSHETHELAQRKVDQMSKLATALGINANKEGEAFNRDLQEQKRAQVQREREDREIERAQRQQQIDKERKKRDKEDKKREKERKKADKEKEEKESQRHERSAKLREEWEQRKASTGTRDSNVDDRAPSGSGRDRGNRQDQDRGPISDGLRSRMGGQQTQRDTQRVYQRHEPGPDRYEPDYGREEQDPRVDARQDRSAQGSGRGEPRAEQGQARREWDQGKATESSRGGERQPSKALANDKQERSQPHGREEREEGERPSGGSGKQRGKGAEAGRPRSRRPPSPSSSDSDGSRDRRGGSSSSGSQTSDSSSGSESDSSSSSGRSSSSSDSSSDSGSESSDSGRKGGGGRARGKGKASSPAGKDSKGRDAKRPRHDSPRAQRR